MLIIETSSFLKEALSVPKTVLLSSHTRNMHLYIDGKMHFHRPTRGAGDGRVTLITCVRANSEICLYPSQTGFWGLLGKGGEDRWLAVRIRRLSARLIFHFPHVESIIQLKYDNSTWYEHKIWFAQVGLLARVFTLTTTYWKFRLFVRTSHTSFHRVVRLKRRKLRIWRFLLCRIFLRGKTMDTGLTRSACDVETTAQAIQPAVLLVGSPWTRRCTTLVRRWLCSWLRWWLFTRQCTQGYN